MVKRLGMYGAFSSIPKGPTDSAWRRWYHAAGRRGIMLRPDERKDRTTVFMYVIDKKGQQTDAGRDEGEQRDRTTKGTNEGALF